jgi:5-methylcytosine-specific restriction endonuclease McrBC regulatory subunit McrC
VGGGGGGGGDHRRRHRDDRAQNVCCVSKYTRVVSSKRIQKAGAISSIAFQLLSYNKKKKEHKLGTLLQGGQELII